jgi:hypothetical protein
MSTLVKVKMKERPLLLYNTENQCFNVNLGKMKQGLHM